MKLIFCPRCRSTKLENISIEGTYKCLSCGYVGSLNIPKHLFRQFKK
ncbi:MAG: hypothetical protein QXG00_08670 [Candidatus Woesearchaeota archaeon]